MPQRQREHERDLRLELYREVFRLPPDNRERIAVFQEALGRAVATELTDRQRTIILMHYYEQKSDACIAGELGVHPSTICRTRRRAEQRLPHSLRFYAEFLHATIV